MLHYYLAAVIDTSGLPNHTPHNTVQTVLGIVFAFAASISLLMVVIGGLKYVLSQGDPNSMASAKNTIIYALIGLGVTLAAFSIVTFVLKGIS